jgi:hypothetical protein
MTVNNKYSFEKSDNCVTRSHFKHSILLEEMAEGMEPPDTKKISNFIRYTIYYGLRQTFNSALP